MINVLEFLQIFYTESIKYDGIDKRKIKVVCTQRNRMDIIDRLKDNNIVVKVEEQGTVITTSRVHISFLCKNLSGRPHEPLDYLDLAGHFGCMNTDLTVMFKDAIIGDKELGYIVSRTLSPLTIL